MNSEKLFSYGTLRYEAVQLATFGRKLTGISDNLHGFHLSTVEIKNSDVVTTSGEASHPILIHTGDLNDTVSGMVFEITPDELKKADEYEVEDYKRIRVKLNSGISAWVYVSVNSA